MDEAKRPPTHEEPFPDFHFLLIKLVVWWVCHWTINLEERFATPRSLTSLAEPPATVPCHDLLALRVSPF